ncbi:MAG: hypothetical protein AAGI53_06865 [Planctomycetota bacterium]
MPSDLDRIIKTSKRLESLLEHGLGGHGKGLHEKASSVESKLTPDLVRDIRTVATVRNKLVHEEGYDKIENRSEVFERAKRAEDALEKLASGPRKPQWFTATAMAVLVLVGLATAAFLVLKLRGII